MICRCGQQSAGSCIGCYGFCGYSLHPEGGVIAHNCSVIPHHGGAYLCHTPYSKACFPPNPDFKHLVFDSPKIKETLKLYQEVLKAMSNKEQDAIPLCSFQDDTVTEEFVTVHL